MPQPAQHKAAECGYQLHPPPTRQDVGGVECKGHSTKCGLQCVYYCSA